MTRHVLTLRWIAVLPGAIFCALLASFPIHWTVMLIRSWGRHVDDDGSVIYDNPLAAIPEEVLELFGYAYFTPFIVISVGARIAPKFKFKTGIILSLGLVCVYAYISNVVAEEISSGMYSFADWLRLAITILLCISGIICGLLLARKSDKAMKNELI